MKNGPVNLNKARKERTRAAKRAEADANSSKFGRSKAERLAQAKAAAAALKRHEDHKRDA